MSRTHNRTCWIVKWCNKTTDISLFGNFVGVHFEREAFVEFIERRELRRKIFLHILFLWWMIVNIFYIHPHAKRESIEFLPDQKSILTWIWYAWIEFHHIPRLYVRTHIVCASCVCILIKYKIKSNEINKYHILIWRVWCCFCYRTRESQCNVWRVYFNRLYFLMDVVGFLLGFEGYTITTNTHTHPYLVRLCQSTTFGEIAMLKTKRQLNFSGGWFPMKLKPIYIWSC